jgi:hypothetical protein
MKACLSITKVTMETFFTSLSEPQIFILAGLVLFLLVALVARFFESRKHPRTPRSRYGDDHSQAITEMSQRTRAEAQRRESRA